MSGRAWGRRGRSGSGVDIMLLDQLQNIFAQAKILEECRYSSIVPIFKENGPSKVGGIMETSR